MEVNQKRQPDSEPARDALPSSPAARQQRTVPGHSRQTLQRWALGGVGALGLTALVTLAGCPANLDNPERFADGGNAPPADNLPACLAKLFNKDPLVGKCAGGGCHNQNNIGFGGDLDLASPGVASRLINVTATHGGVDMDGGGANCPTAKLIDTANPMASWLLVKINGAQGNCGSTMPQVGTLTSTDKTCITSYVMGVAADAGAAMSGTGGMSSGGSGGSTAIAGTGGTPGAGGSGGAAMGGSGGSGGASGGASGSAGTGGT